MEIIVSNEDDKLHKETYDNNNNNNNNNNLGSVGSRPKCCVLNKNKNNNQLTRVETQGSASAEQKNFVQKKTSPNLNDTS